VTQIDLPSAWSPVGKVALAADGSTFSLARDGRNRTHLSVCGDAAAGFDGESYGAGTLCRLTPENARRLAERLPWLRPRRLLPDGQSFGFGDRLGLATPGHIRAVWDRGIFPILAQQSVRENSRTGRTFADVLADAVFSALREGYEAGFGADADHLKEIADAEEAAGLGYTFFTCDPGDLLEDVDSLDPVDLRKRFSDLPDEAGLRERHSGRSYAVGDSLVLHFAEEEFLRTAVKYSRALDHATRMYEAIDRIAGGEFDYEVSVDETVVPTTALEHLFVALELRHRGVRIASVARTSRTRRMGVVTSRRRVRAISSRWESSRTVTRPSFARSWHDHCPPSSETRRPITSPPTRVGSLRRTRSPMRICTASFRPTTADKSCTWRTGQSSGALSEMT